MRRKKTNPDQITIFTYLAMVEQAAPEQALPEQVSPEQAAPKQAAEQQTKPAFPEDESPKQISQTSSGQISSEQISQTSSGQTQSEQVSSEHILPKQKDSEIISEETDVQTSSEQTSQTSSVQDSFEQVSSELDFPAVHGQPEQASADQVTSEESVQMPAANMAENFHITDDCLGEGSLKQKFAANLAAIKVLKKIESENRFATKKEQEILSKYVGWGGIPQAFDQKAAGWHDEYRRLKAMLTEEEYEQAESSTLTAFYTPPVVIKKIYDILLKMGLTGGNILEPSCGTGNFFGLVPDELKNASMYGVELDSISGRIAKMLYPKNNILVTGFEKANLQENFFDCVIGNIPFGNYQVADRKYDKHHFLIHDYFLAKSIDLVRPGGIVAVLTSSGTMDKKDSSCREYLAMRADLLGAIRLPNNTFSKNANTHVVSDILFFQKRESAPLSMPEWTKPGWSYSGPSINMYFEKNPHMVLGEIVTETSQYGKEVLTVNPYPEMDLGKQLESVDIHGHIHMGSTENTPYIPADPDVKNFSFALLDGKLYYREDSIMHEVDLPKTTMERVIGMIELRDLTKCLLNAQMEDCSDECLHSLQKQLNEKYDAFTAKFGLINSTGNRRAFSQDDSYCLLSSLEILDEDGRLKSKADVFTKRTIKQAEPVTSVDTASEALAVSLAEKARVNLAYMMQLTGKTEEVLLDDLTGVIFEDPVDNEWKTAEEYLSGNVREKLATARQFAEIYPEYEINVKYLEKVQPKDLDASEISVHLGVTWVDPKYIDDFMLETFKPPKPWIKPTGLYGRPIISTKYAAVTGQWNISGKNADTGNPLANSTYGTARASAYRILEDALNLRDTKIYDYDENDKRILNKKETILAQQKQEMIREAFKEWIFKDMERRDALCALYNEKYNSIRPREYDGSHIQFYGMNPQITLMPHQKNAVAHVIYGHNTLLAHAVGAGKTFEMVAAGMEMKRLGLVHKSMYVVPNHLTEQWGAEFLRLYPGANILVTTKKDFSTQNRKKFCARIATGLYDAIIIGHSQFEKIPLSKERQIENLDRQINDIIVAMDEAKYKAGEQFSVKQMAKMKKVLEARLERLNDQSNKDDVVTFEQLGIDHLFVDESHNYKNLFIQTKMRNVAGISQTDAKKSSDMFMKCQYLDEITGGRGVTFATGTPISNSMVELYTIMRYLMYDKLQELGFGYFDSWAATFGETVTSIELSPEGTGYRAKTRFARFFNLPELMSIFKEIADIQTADKLNLPGPEAEYVNIALYPSSQQKDMVASFGERADKIRNGSIDPKKDNMLCVTNDGRKCALDQRLMDDSLPDHDQSKASSLSEHVYQIWKDTEEDRLTQLVFCDLSTPRPGIFNVYDDVRDKLMEKGIPKEEIAYIHEASTETQKTALFSKVRSGQVRVLLGSTFKLGTGTNIQDKLVALHHLDCPWRPSDLEQQEGRILRQGNTCEKVKIFRYVTKNSFDAYMWQIVENKQKFISQIMTSKSPARSCEDVDDTALSYAEIKALATGNPLIKEKMELDVQVSKLKLLQSNYMRDIYRMESNITKSFPRRLADLKARLRLLKMDYSSIIPMDKESFSMMVNGQVYTDKKEAGLALMAACGAMKKEKSSGLIGEYHGFTLKAQYDLFEHNVSLVLHREFRYRVELGNDALGNIQRINNELCSLERKIEITKQKYDQVKHELALANEEVRKPFPQEKELKSKMERLTELNLLLDMDKKDMDAVGVDEVA